MPAPCQEKLYSPVWPGPVQEQEKAERPAEHSCISTQALCRAGRKTTYVLLSEINNITLPELNACYSQKLIRWHEQSFGL